ncbi:hypothetical protein ODJ79_09500 [Actinoplanes sp. KI2]|uniref:hypothetical protein n=1 Tax=Actinoplanes sp. KI2 TaxID=2983315 RepID=UPI0021D5DD0A|nr:hypothetical protein [Actinoplanes sp. KI2]MCU7723949.1 hypothetical protein [Actinoplanes sp. KI2]
MKRRLIRIGISAMLAVGVALPITAQPASAAVDPLTVIKVIQQIYSVYKGFTSGGGGGPTLQQAIQQITTAIQSAQNAITSQIDLVAAADVKACADSAVVNFADINALSSDNLQAFALATTACVTQANSLLNVVTDKSAADQLGFAMNTVGPLALMARIKAGLTTPGLTSVLVAGENTLITALLPACHQEDLNGGEPGTPHVLVWDCFAYNGNEGVAKKRATSENSATSNTSRAVAQNELPVLTT